MSQTYTLKQVLDAAKQHMLDGQWAEAAELYRRCAEQIPDEFNLLSNLGVCLMELEQLDEAGATLARATELAPEHPEVHFNLGVLAQRQLDWPGAHSQFKRVVDADPSHLDALRGLRDTLSTLGRANEALAVARQAVSHHAAMVPDHLALAQAYHEAGDADGAYEIYAEVQEQDPENSLVQANINLAARFRDGVTPGGWPAPLMAELDRVNAGAEIKMGQRDAPRVGFHLFAPYHLDVLKPIFDAVGGDAHRMMAIDIDPLVSFGPDIVVTAETHIPHLRHRMPETKFVYVRHGLIDKNALGPALRTADVVCLPSESMCNRVRAAYGEQRAELWATGYAHMDCLFLGTAPPLPMRIAEDKKIILYAPTWNAEYSSAFDLGDKVAEHLIGERDDAVLIVKPHPNLAGTSPKLITAWQSMALTRTDTHVAAPEDDVMPYLAAANVLVSDVSSVAFSFLALDRPIIFYTRDGAQHSPLSRDGSVEWRWRDIGEEVFDAAALADAVARALDGQDLQVGVREECCDELFGNLRDGQAAARIAEHLMRLNTQRSN